MHSSVIAFAMDEHVVSVPAVPSCPSTLQAACTRSQCTIQPLDSHLVRDAGPVALQRFVLRPSGFRAGGNGSCTAAPCAVVFEQ